MGWQAEKSCANNRTRADVGHRVLLTKLQMWLRMTHVTGITPRGCGDVSCWSLNC